MNVEYSENVTGRDIKVLLWGAPASRKTESILRYFPRVFLVDCEGNSGQCIGMPEIPPFLRVVTKDIYEVLQAIDDVVTGKIKFPDGSPVETLAIDGLSVLWSVRQEVGAMAAEKRAAKYNKTADEAHMTMLDWVMSKRPVKRLHARMNAVGIKFFIVTAREKVEYEEVTVQGKTELKKVGVMLDSMRGIDYEVNLALHMIQDPGKPWRCEVTKTHGALGTLFPEGTVLATFPHEAIIAHATGTGIAGIDEVTVAEGQLKRELAYTQKNLIEIAKQRGLETKDVATILKAAGIERFDVDQWDEMVAAIEGFQLEE